MTGSARLRIGLVVGLIVMPRALPAAVPSAEKSTWPKSIRLVGSSAGAPDAAVGEFLVVVRDLAENPKNGASVVLDFSQNPSVVLCSDQLDAEALVNCEAKTVRKFTNVIGEVRFTILGKSVGPASVVPPEMEATIYANGTRFGHPKVAIFDLDGTGGMGAGDLSAWFTDFGTGVFYARSDFDLNGRIGANDLSEWLDVWGAHGSTESCSASCP